MNRRASNTRREGRAIRPIEHACKAPTWPATPNRDETADRHHDQPDAVECIGLFVLWCACIVALIGAISLAAGAVLI